MGVDRMELSEMILERAGSLKEQMVAWRRQLHRCPELGLETDATQAFVRGELEKMGYEPRKVGKAGMVALAGKGGGKVFLLRADMDALPLEEDSGEEFRSENPGKMHACGHDMHTAMLLGAAKILKENEDLIEGQVKLMFQSGEETGTGARDMVEAGVLEDPKVDAAEMIHVATGAPFPAGLVMIPQGGTGASASCMIAIRVKGRGGHGAMPSVCVDPITAICHIHSGLEEIFAREAGLSDYLAITFGKISAGEAPNIIPDSAEMLGSIRTMSTEKMEWAQKRIREIAEAIGAAYRAEVSVEYTHFLPAMIAEPEVTGCAVTYMRELLGPGAMEIPAGQNGGGSEDFAHVAAKVPSVPMFLAAGNAKEGYLYPAHNPKARFDESALPNGAAAHAYLAIRWLRDHK